jgi:hypothetical protein
MAGLLCGGGAFAVYKSSKIDKAYLAAAMMPLMVGVQQLAEGVVWSSLTYDLPRLTIIASAIYLYFVWIVWPVWVAFLTLCLEPERGKKLLFGAISLTGLGLGAFLYLPYYFGENSFGAYIAHHSIAYQRPPLLDEFNLRHWSYAAYLAIIALPPLLSSHKALRLFGIMLLAFVPATYLAFAHAYISVLCFFAALCCLYLGYVIIHDLCGLKSPPGKAIKN